MNPDDFFKTLDNRALQKNQALKEQQTANLSVENTQAIIDSIGVAIKSLMAFHAQHQPKVSVTNQKLPISIKTPDIKEVVKALENLKQPLQENKPDNTEIIKALAALKESITKLPTTFPDIPAPVETVTVKNQRDYTKQFDNLGAVIKGIDVKPVINIPPETPDDYTPIIDSLSSVLKAVKAIKIPEVPQTDLTPLIIATNSVQDSINNLRFPVPNYVLPFKDPSGKATQANVDSNGYIVNAQEITTNRYDYSNPNVIYTGSAAPGANESDSTWTLNKYDLTSSSDALGVVAFNSSWTNRTSAVYE